MKLTSTLILVDCEKMMSVKHYVLLEEEKVKQNYYSKRTVGVDNGRCF